MEKTLKKIIALALVVLMLCSIFTACSSKDDPGSSVSAENSEDTNAERVLGIGFAQDPSTLDPFSAGSAARYFILLQVYEKLALMSNTGELTGVLAKSWTHEGMSYTVELYDYIKDSEGNPFTADDAVWCLQTQMEMGTNSNLNSIESVEKVDTYTFKINLTSNLVGVFEAICVNTFYCTKAAYEASSDKMASKPIGTGPYKMDKVEMGTSYSMVVNENYWQKEDLRKMPEQQNSGCDRVNYYIQGEAAQLIVALETGVVDVIISDSDSTMRFQEGGAAYGQGISVDFLSKAGNSMLFLNCSNNSPFYQNVALRKAVLYAVDVPSIIEAAKGGHATVPTSFVAAGKYADMGTKWVDHDYFTTDVEKAKQYLSEAGYAEGELTLTLLGQTGSSNMMMYEAIKGSLAKIGISVEIDVYEGAIYQTSMYDPAAWDLLCDGKGATDYAASVIRAKLLNTTTEFGTMGFIQDDHLQELVEAAVDVNTHSADTVDAVFDYVEEQAYAMGIMSDMECIAYNSDKIAEYSFNVDTRPAPGAFVLK